MRASGGEAVKGGVEEDGDAAGADCVEKGEGVESVLDLEDEAGSCDVEADEEKTAISRHG